MAPAGRRQPSDRVTLSRKLVFAFFALFSWFLPPRLPHLLDVVRRLQDCIESELGQFNVLGSTVGWRNQEGSVLADLESLWTPSKLALFARRGALGLKFAVR